MRIACASESHHARTRAACGCVAAALTTPHQRHRRRRFWMAAIATAWLLTPRPLPPSRPVARQCASHRVCHSRDARPFARRRIATGQPDLRQDETQGRWSGSRCAARRARARPSSSNALAPSPRRGGGGHQNSTSASRSRASSCMPLFSAINESVRLVELLALLRHRVEGLAQLRIRLGELLRHGCTPCTSPAPTASCMSPRGAAAAEAVDGTRSRAVGGAARPAGLPVRRDGDAPPVPATPDVPDIVREGEHVVIGRAGGGRGELLELKPGATVRPRISSFDDATNKAEGERVGTSRSPAARSFRASRRPSDVAGRGLRCGVTIAMRRVSGRR